MSRSLVLDPPFDLCCCQLVMSNEEVQAVTSLLWNNYPSSIVLTLISYEYLLQFEKEVTYVWQKRWSLMSWLYLTVSFPLLTHS
ncbi:hypothetical protein AZE42_04893 [Rhizopogon vesiculosus]|uniref:DUF6533 domain-containing protein n=1 Tax=Rhizopogon vesiculosus TaxID=180088 RepID=A0A1J8QHU0_9AGAM|nr:hypothetical protein AZE42_04893 [Rhizopogon vesiculosus]